MNYSIFLQKLLSIQKFNSVINNSYDSSDRNQNLKDRLGSLPTFAAESTRQQILGELPGTRAVLVFATERKNNVNPHLRSQKKVNCVHLPSENYVHLPSNWCTTDMSNIYESPTYRTRSTKVKSDQVNYRH